MNASFKYQICYFTLSTEWTKNRPVHKHDNSSEGVNDVLVSHHSYAFSHVPLDQTISNTVNYFVLWFCVTACMRLYVQILKIGHGSTN
jgi:hypothetical protein